MIHQSIPRAFGRSVVSLALCVGFGIALGQSSPLTLGEALRRAKTYNGDVQSAYFRTKATEADRNRANAAYLPTLTPSFEYSTGLSRNFTGANRGPTSHNQSSTTAVDFSWRLLDNGRRRYNSVVAGQNLAAQREASLRTLRSTLFLVHQRFYEALRTQELLRVNEAQEQRARTILDQTETRVNVGDAAQKDILQARADTLNARVNVLQARTQAATAQANLKSEIGWVAAEPLPELEKPNDEVGREALPPLAAMIERGLKNRNDLRSQRAQLEVNRIDIRLAELDAGVTFSLDASYRHNFAKDVFNNGGLTLSATYPLFDGGASREVIRARKFSYESARANLIQAERDVAAEIESAYIEHEQNFERLEATAAALAAAQENFRAASEAQRLGAGNVIDVLTAQVSLVTAESNRVEAVYDYLISQVRLRLATGDPIPGESDS